MFYSKPELKVQQESQIFVLHSILFLRMKTEKGK